MQISVIIPAYNEAESIGRCLGQFKHAEGVDVVVVDGGSTDDTPDAVKRLNVGQCVVSPERGRAAQMNFGARSSTGTVLLFLHADTFLPKRGVDLIREALADEDVLGGCFALGLDDTGFGFRLIAGMSTWRSKYLGITYGDQGVFVRRHVFDEVGGYPDLHLFEDSEFCKAVAQCGAFVKIPEKVQSSARRWKKWGVVQTVIWMWVLRILFVCGVSDKTLSRWYRTAR